MRKSKLGTISQFKHFRRGKLLWESDWNHNYLADGGEQSMLDVYFRAATAPSLYITLLTADPGETGTPATMAENAGTGYARIILNRNNTDFPTLALDVGDYKVTSVAKTFTAGGTWSACTHMGIVTSASGTTGALIAVNALGATRTLINTDTLAITFATKLQ